MAGGIFPSVGQAKNPATDPWAAVGEVVRDGPPAGNLSDLVAGQNGTPAEDPWAAVGEPAHLDFGSAPAGVIIHGKDADYLSNDPSISIKRNSDDSQRDIAVKDQALLKRENLSREAMPFFQGLSLGWGDEAVSGLNAAIRAARGGSFQNTYDVSQEAQRQALAQERLEHPIRSTVGQLAGGLTTALGTAGYGLTPRAAGSGLLPQSVAGLVDGGIYGLVSGAGEGSGLQDRALNAGVGGVLGGAIGGATPAVVSGAGKVTQALLNLSPFAGRNAAQTADAALLSAARQSGMGQDQVVDALTQAQAQGQPGYAVADALGNPGQRLVSAVTRAPNDERGPMIDFLQARQAAQGRRVNSFLQDASGSPQTAQQMGADLAAQRSAQANVDYGNIARDAPVWNPELQALTNRPSVQAGIANARNVAAERGYGVENPFVRADDGTLALPAGTQPTAQFWDTVKRAIDQQIPRDPLSGRVLPEGRDVNGTQQELLRILDQNIPGYAEARAPYAATSRQIDSIDTGARAAQRGRYEDTIPTFNTMSPEEQQGFRTGYFDRLAENTQGQAPFANRVSPLRAEGIQQELPVFAAPGQAEPLAARLGREQQMYDTYAAGTGGSKTADNLADNAGPGLPLGAIAKLLQGRPVDAAATLARGSLDRMQGYNPESRAALGMLLRNTDPQTAGAAFQRAVAARAKSAEQEAVINALLGRTAAGDDPAAPYMKQLLLGR